MKKEKKIATLLIILVFLIVGVLHQTSQLSSSMDDFLRAKDILNEKNDERREPTLKLSGHWTLHNVIIHPLGFNFTDAVSAGWCSGDGSWGTPYVIENVTFDAQSSDSGLTIAYYYSTVYFIIKNCTFINSGSDHDNAGLTLYYTSNGKIINNTFTNNQIGLILSNSQNNTVADNTVYDNDYIGIALDNGDNNNLSLNEVYDNDFVGIALSSYSENNAVSENTASDSQYGICLDQSTNNNVSGNDVYYNDLAGIGLNNSNHNSFWNNTANNNDGDGIRLEYSHNNTITGNNVTNNDNNGIVLENSENNNITGNKMVSNNMGINIMADSNGNLLFNNTITDNDDLGINSFQNNYNNISNNIVSNSESGIEIAECGFYRLIENDVYNNDHDGIGIVYSNNITIHDNFVKNNTYGIYIIESHDINVTGNNVTDCDDGINVVESHDINVTGNNVTDCHYGIYLFEGSDFHVEGNNMTNCGIFLETEFRGSLAQLLTNKIENNLVNNRAVYYYASELGLGGNNFTNPGQIILVNCNDTVITELNINHTTCAIALYFCVNTTITHNSLKDNNGGGIFMEYCKESTIEYNNISVKRGPDIDIWECTKAKISGNILAGMGLILLVSVLDDLLSNDVDNTNTVKGRPIYYYENKTGLGTSDFIDAGQIHLVNCTDSIIENINFPKGAHGVLLDFCNNITVFNNSFSDAGVGVLLGYCNNSKISENTIHNVTIGIVTFYSNDNSFFKNNVSMSEVVGILIQWYSNNNTVSENTLNKNYYGILLQLGCNYTTIIGNNITENADTGILLQVNCHNNTISGNNIYNTNDVGLTIGSGTSDNMAFNNYFVGNSENARDDGTNNAWDNGTIGNYWDDYSGRDWNDDGIGEDPYDIPGSAGSQDNYPIWNDGIDINNLPEVLIFGTKYGIYSLDPHYAWDTASIDVIDQVVESLFAYNLSDPQLSMVPRLAKEMGNWSIDNINYTVELRQGVLFHDGSNFNASSVEWNFNRLAYFMNISGSLPGDTYLTQFRTLYLWPDGTPIINRTVINSEYNLTFVLNKPYAAFEALLCFSGSGILSPLSTSSTQYLDKDTDDLVGTGPFVYDEYIPNSKVVFHGFDDYWAGAPKITNLTFLIVPDEYQRNLLLLYGVVDYIKNPSSSFLVNFTNDPHISLTEPCPSQVGNYLGMNNKQINKTMRQAISFAINYSYIINEIMNGEAVRLNSSIPESMPYANWTNNFPTFNITKARMIFKNAGIRQGLDPYNDTAWLMEASSNPIATYNYSYNTGSQFREETGNLIEQNLALIGINVTVIEMSWSEYSGRLFNMYGYSNDMLQLFSIGWLPDLNDPSSVLNMLYSNTSNCNFAQVNDPFLELNMSLGLAYTNSTVRKQIYDEIQRYLVEDLMPYAYFFVGLQTGAHRIEYTGFQPNPLGKAWFYNVESTKIYIDGSATGSGAQNWTWAASQPWCKGSGTWGDPYIIENVTINGDNYSNCVRIENSIGIYFVIKNCTLFNTAEDKTGISLENVSNGLIQDCVIHDTYFGIVIKGNSFNNTILENEIFNTETGVGRAGILMVNSTNNNITNNDVYFNEYGIVMINSTNNRICNNTFNNNTNTGITLRSNCHDNYLFNNTINYNGMYGLVVDNNCNNNTIFKNVLNFNNDYGIVINDNCNYTKILNNTANYNVQAGIFIQNNCNNSTVSNNSACYTVNLGGEGIRIDIDCNYNTISGNLACFNGHGIYILSNDNTILGNTLSNNSGYGMRIDGHYNNISGNIASNNSEAGISLQSSHDNTISNNTCANNQLFGIYMISSNDNTISNNTCANNNLFGIYMTSGSYNNTVIGNEIYNTETGVGGAGILMQNCDYNNITGNDISGINNGNGIQLSNCSYTIISKNTIKDISEHAIHLDNCPNATISYNNLSYSENGMNIHNSNDMNIFENNLTFNIHNGIMLTNCHENNITNNEAYFNEFGILLINSSNNRICNNTANNSTNIGISLYSYCSENYLFNNTINYNGMSGIEVENNCHNNTIFKNVMNFNNNYGIFINDNCNYTKMLNNTANYNVQTGIYIENNCNNSTISNNSACYAVNFGGEGIRIDINCNNNMISGNLICFNGRGIYILSDDNEILGNTLLNNINGLRVDGKYNKILGNMAYNNTESGINLHSSHDNIISNNTCANTQLFGIYLVSGSYNNTVIGNIILDSNYLGIFLNANVNETIVAQNKLINNYVGLAVVDLSYDNVIYSNEFIGSSILQAMDNGTNTQWDNGSIGNYWSDYTGIDADDDNIGDAPYNISGTAMSQDIYPIWDDGDDLPPIINIVNPLPQEMCGESAPSFIIEITDDSSIASMWYSLNLGATNITFTENGTIHQFIWNLYGEGNITIQFYARDEFGHIGFSDVEIRKDASPPSITINTPNTNDLYNSTAPSFNITITDVNFNSSWYSLYDGTWSANNTFEGNTGIIDHSIWLACANGTIIIRFFANDTSNQIQHEDVTVLKDSSAPTITINTPFSNDIFRENAPDFNVTIVDYYLDETWYMLINASNPSDRSGNYTFSGTIDTIDLQAWASFENGTILIRFFANDTLGNLNFKDVIVRKDIIQPGISVQSPNPNEIIGKTAPNFIINVAEPNLDTLWYTIDGGITNKTFTSNISIDQALWNALPNGTVVIKFYANDTAGNINFAEVFVRKDIIDPTITINLPNKNDIFDELAPSYDVVSIDPFLDDTWYGLFNGSEWSQNISFSSTTGNINQALWDALPNGTITIRFYANDTAGNINFTDVIVHRDIMAPIITINTPEFLDLFGGNAPQFDLTIIEGNLDTTWYMLKNDSISTQNFTFTGLTESINETLWDQFTATGNVTMIFYANDTFGHISSVNVTVEKNIVAPVITITYPLPNEVCGSEAPSFEVVVSAGAAARDTTWYTLDDGVTNFTFTGEIGNINQSAWDALGDGPLSVTIKFYVNNSLGSWSSDTITITKDIDAPLVVINLPINETTWNSAPSINITAFDPNLDRIWYSVGGYNISLTNNTEQELDSMIWSNLDSECAFEIYIYAIDLAGNFNNTYVITLNKDVIDPNIAIESYNSTAEYETGSVVVVCNVTDYSELKTVDPVQIMYYYPNDTLIGTYNMLHESGDIYNYTWNTNGYDIGENYYFIIIADDNVSNSDSTTQKFFAIEDTVNATVILDTRDATVDYGTGSMFVNLTATDNYGLRDYDAVLIMFYHPNGTLIGTYNMIHDSGDIYNYTWDVNSYEPDEDYYFRVLVYDNSSNCNNTIMENFTIVDNVNPSVKIESYYSEGIYGNGKILVFINVTDNHETVLPVNILFYYPNATIIDTYTMVILGADRYKITWLTSGHPLLDNYYFIINATDLSGNYNDTVTKTFNIIEIIKPEISVDYYNTTVEWSTGTLIVNASVTDNYVLNETDPVKISIYNSTGDLKHQGIMTELVDDVFTYSWSVSGQLLGENYYFTITATDNNTNSRTTSRYYFDIVDNVKPNVNYKYSDAFAYYGVGTITVNVTASDNEQLNETTPLHITFYEPDDTVICTYYMSLILSNYTCTWSVGSYDPDVGYYFIVTAYDNSENSNSTIEYYFDIIDLTDPSVSVLFYESVADVNTGSITVSCNITDNHGIDNVEIIFFNPSNALLTSDTMNYAGGNYYSYTWDVNSYPYADDYYFNITAHDLSDNANDPVKLFFNIVDHGQPNITVSPVSSVEWNTGTLRVDAIVKDNYELNQNDPVKISLYYVNGTVFVTNATMNNVSNNYYYEFSMVGFPLERNYHFKILANDSAGNVEITPFHSFDVVDTVDPVISNIEVTDTQMQAWPGVVKVTVTVTDNYGLRSTSPVQITFYYPDASVLGTFDMSFIGSNEYTHTLSGLNSYDPETGYYFIVTAFDTSSNDNSSIQIEFEILDIIIFQSAGYYKGYEIKTPVLRYYQNPSKSDYVVVISSLTAQAGYIEKCLKSGQSVDLDYYRQQIRNAINATLDAHPNAYIYIMDRDLGHVNNSYYLQLHFNGFWLMHKYGYYGSDGTAPSFALLNNGGPRDYYGYYYYRSLIQLKVFKVKNYFYEHTNVLILGDSLEFPEFIYEDGFSDSMYLAYGSYMLGGIGRLPIEKTEAYFNAIKYVNFEKKFNLAGGSYYNKLYYLFYRQLDGWGKGYSGEFYYGSNPSNINQADLIISGFYGHIQAGPLYDGAAYDPEDFDPSLMMGYSNSMSNTLYFDREYGYFFGAFGGHILDKGVTTLGASYYTYVSYYTYRFDSAYLQMMIMQELFRGRFSTLGQVYSSAISRYQYYRYAAQIRLIGDPGLDVSNFDDLSEETVDYLPESFETQFLIDYDVNNTADGDYLYINSTTTLNDPRVNEMQVDISFASVFGGELIVPTLVYSLEMPKNQSLENMKLILTDNRTYDVPIPMQEKAVLFTEDGEVAVANINIEGDTTYSRMSIDISEYSLKKIYKITIFPALWMEELSSFEGSRDITLQFEIINITLASNATLSYEECEFTLHVNSNENYTLGFNLNNAMNSVENASNVIVTVQLPSGPDGLTILDTNGGVSGSSVSWSIDEIENSYYFYIEYNAPSSITVSEYKEITISVMYTSLAEGIKTLEKTIRLYYLSDNLCNLELRNVVISGSSPISSRLRNSDISISVTYYRSYYSFDVINSGELDVSNIQIYFLVNDEVMNSITEDLEAGQTITVMAYHNFAEAGTYDLKIQIIALEYESNKLDNIFEQQIIIVDSSTPETPSTGGGGGAGPAAIVKEEAPPTDIVEVPDYLFLILIMLAIVPSIIAAFLVIRRRGMIRIKEARERVQEEFVEGDIVLKEKKLVCIVHRGLVAGAVYICPSCQSIYCENCALALKDNKENCWACDHEITIERPPTIEKKKVKKEKVEAEEEVVEDVEPKDETVEDEEKPTVIGVIPTEEEPKEAVTPKAPKEPKKAESKKATAPKAPKAPPKKTDLHKKPRKIKKHKEPKKHESIEKESDGKTPGKEESNKKDSSNSGIDE